MGVSGDYNLHIAFAFFEEKSNLVSALNVIGPSGFFYTTIVVLFFFDFFSD